MSKGRVLRTELADVAELLVDNHISRKVSIFLIFFGVGLKYEAHYYFSQFLFTLLRRMKYSTGNRAYRLPETILVHSKVVANGHFMKQPGILRADEDFMVKYKAFSINA